MEDERKSPSIAGMVVHPDTSKFLLYRKATGFFDKRDPSTKKVIESYKDQNFMIQADAIIRSLKFKIDKEIKYPDDFCVVTLKDYLEQGMISLIKGLPIYQRTVPVSSGRAKVTFYTLDTVEKVVYVSSYDANTQSD